MTMYTARVIERNRAHGWLRETAKKQYFIFPLVELP
jgi:hypothetical protein